MIVYLDQNLSGPALRRALGAVDASTAVVGLAQSGWHMVPDAALGDLIAQAGGAALVTLDNRIKSNPGELYGFVGRVVLVCLDSTFDRGNVDGRIARLVGVWPAIVRAIVEVGTGHVLQVGTRHVTVLACKPDSDARLLVPIGRRPH